MKRYRSGLSARLTVCAQKLNIHKHSNSIYIVIQFLEDFAIFCLFMAIFSGYLLSCCMNPNLVFVLYYNFPYQFSIIWCFACIRAKRDRSKKLPRNVEPKRYRKINNWDGQKYCVFWQASLSLTTKYILQFCLHFSNNCCSEILNINQFIKVVTNCR